MLLNSVSADISLPIMGHGKLRPFFGPGEPSVGVLSLA